MPILSWKPLLGVILILPPLQTSYSADNQRPDPKIITLVQEVLEIKKQTVPSFDKEILEPLKASQEQAKKDAEEAARKLAEARAVTYTYYPVYVPYVASGELTGSFGYARAGGNCILEPGINNPGWGNPIDWPVLYSEPAIGRTALFTYNHTSVIVGLWSNGDIEVRHQNWSGAPRTRFPRSAFRGYR